jgi:hypothetical protein
MIYPQMLYEVRKTERCPSADISSMGKADELEMDLLVSAA